MNPQALRKLFEQVRKKRLSPDEAVERLRHLPFEDLGFAKIDHHRALRQGMPEVIFSQGKTPRQVADIFSRLAAHGGNVLATRATEEQFAAVAAALDLAEYRPIARAIVLKRDRKRHGKGVIVVVSAGTGDIPVAEEAVVTAELMGNNVQHIYDVGVAGIHRLLAHRGALAKARVIVVCAGMEGAAKRSRRPGRSPGNCRSDERRLWRRLRGPRRSARDDELLRLKRQRSQHR